MKIARLGGVAALALTASASLLGLQPARQPSAYAPSGTPIELGLAGYAKVLCSAIFVSGRDPNEAVKNSGFFMMPAGQAEKVTWTVDRERQVVRMSLDGVTREAKFYGDQGCIIHQKHTAGIFFTPVPVRTTLPDAMTQRWPMGDADAEAPPLPGVDRSQVNAAVEAAFADPQALTAAFIVVHKARIVAERYMPGITKDTQLESWSMGKSITAALFALLVKDGTYTLEEPAPVPAWQSPDDPRSKIRNIDLLRMSSGLRFIAGQDPDYTEDKGYPDHMFIYAGAVDAFTYSINRPLQFPPNTEGRYRNSDPLTIGDLIANMQFERASGPKRILVARKAQSGNV